MEPAATSVPLWAIVLTSAGVAAVVSSLATLLGQTLERRARRRELLLSKALELAAAKTQLVMRAADSTGGKARLQEDIVSAETYYQWLEHLLEHGKLPDDSRIQRL